MKKQILLFCGALLLAGCSQTNQSGYSGATGDQYGQGAWTDSTALELSDVTFLREAAQAGHAEVRMGELLNEKASDPTLRQFGRMLMEHHSQGNARLAALATRKGLTIPEEMSPAQQTKLAQLANLSGDRLERAMEKEALDSHVRSLRSYKVAAKQSKDPVVKAFAQGQIPILEEHLNSVRRLAQGSTGIRTGTGMGGANDAF